MTGQATRHPAWAWLVGSLAVLGAVALALVAPTAERGDPSVDVFTQVLLVLAVALAVVVLALRFGPETTGLLLALLTGLFLCVGAAVLLNANSFAPLGAAADQSYRTAYLTKFAHHWGLVDYAYKGLPSFYPPLFFWVLGRFSALSGVAAWHMLKVGLLYTAFLVPVVGWLLWRPVVGPRRAAAVVVVTSLVFQDWYNPHLWLAIAIFVPWWLGFVLGVGRNRRLTKGALVGAILLGAIVALTYWYVLFIGLVQLAGLLLLRRVARTHGRELEPRHLRDVAIVLGGIVVATAIYWLPLAASIISSSGAQTMQNRYYTGDEVPFPTEFFTFDLRGLVLLGGLVWLLATSFRRSLSLHLLGIAAAAYALYFFGYIGFLLDYPLDTLRVRGVIEFVLAAGAALAFLDVAQAIVSRRLSDRVDPKAAAVALGIAAVVVAVAIGQDSVRSIPYLDQQRDAKYPAHLIATFERVTHGNVNNRVVLTSLPDLSSFLPVFVFNTSDAHYSHPAAEFNDRASFLRTLSKDEDPEAFAIALLHNRYDTIDYVVMPSFGNDLVYDYLGDAFPRGVSPKSLSFSKDLFRTPSFTTLYRSRKTMLRVNRNHDPLDALQDCPRRASDADCRVLGDLLNRYAPHLDDETRQLAESWRRARR